eukprot:TRINITY_DN680_c0_g2_i1.p1 TRINITY_DN680_c0_g2~~TRINITY_DN680_c0_g2_i1.p1  ORF type:complete len:959 (+),score=264.83 TRINITY_DN680_c0_g2_i1:31-2877(+)
MCIRDRYQRRVREFGRARMVSALLWLALLATAACQVHELGETQEVQLGETEHMTAQTMAAARKDLVRLATSFRSQDAEIAGIQTSQLAEKVFLQQDAGQAGSGLDLIFRKLDELEKKIKGEEESEAAAEHESLTGCASEISKLNQIITLSSSTRSSNQQEIARLYAKIHANSASWRESREVEKRTQESMVGMQEQRQEESEATRARVDERNKAIDVLVKATHMVCNRFDRYKKTSQCYAVKSKPDVDEPQRYPTKKFNKAKKQTEEMHAKGSEWATEWAAQALSDQSLEGKDDPEGLLDGSVDDPDDPAGNSTTLELLELDGAAGSLSYQQQMAVKELVALSKTGGLKPRFSVPITELAMSLQAGNAARSKSIVTILQGVHLETVNQQATDKATHNANLNSYYGQSWDWKGVMDGEADKQAGLRAENADAESDIKKLLLDNEGRRQDQLAAEGARTQEEDRCAASSEGYGVRSSFRSEDLENIVKLKSLLRALYFKRFPKSCPRFNSAICGGTDRGWCVFTKRQPESSEQRCSCNVGFYGDGCQFQKCPGIAKNLYQASAAAACSNRGVCDDSTGLCSCRPEFFHGPKRACEFKYAPPSKDDPCNPTCDNQCSGRGTFDPVRGKCNCQYEFFGPGCEEMKCPNSNGVLYPRASGNACNGRGPCDVHTGKCGCPVVREGCGKQCGANECAEQMHCGSPFFGPSCELERCPNDCLGRGSCDHNTAKCACSKDRNGTPYYGPSCEFLRCPDDCSGGGECNRNDGKCICKFGFSGVACKRTGRCADKSLNNPEMNWWTVWDKPGWMVCPKGQLLYSLKRSLCQALSCVESGGCAAACEGGSSNHIFQLRHCYHDTRWYDSFDRRGDSQCLDDYFVAGMFRSCESLYCLNMVKCCSLKEARWAKCTWNDWAVFNGPGTARVAEHQFIVGFRRDEGHLLKSLDAAKGCGFVRGF